MRVLTMPITLGYTLSGYTPFQRAYDDPAQPVWAAGHQNLAGDLILLFVESYNSPSPSSIPATPSGYEGNKSPLVNAPSLLLYLRKAAAPNETLPALQYDVAFTTAVAISVTPVGGTIPNNGSLSALFHNIADRAGGGTSTISYPALPISAANCAVFSFGRRQKSTVQNAAAIGNISPDTAFGAPIPCTGAVQQGNFTTLDSVNFWQQVIATSIQADAQTLSVADTGGSGLNYQGLTFALLPPTPAPSGSKTHNLGTMGVGS